MVQSRTCVNVFGAVGNSELLDQKVLLVRGLKVKDWTHQINLAITPNSACSRSPYSEEGQWKCHRIFFVTLSLIAMGAESSDIAWEGRSSHFQPLLMQLGVWSYYFCVLTVFSWGQVFFMWQASINLFPAENNSLIDVELYNCGSVFNLL